MGDCLQYGASQLGWLSLLPFVGW